MWGKNECTFQKQNERELHCGIYQGDLLHSSRFLQSCIILVQTNVYSESVRGELPHHSVTGSCLKYIDYSYLRNLERKTLN